MKRYKPLIEASTKFVQIKYRDANNKVKINFAIKQKDSSINGKKVYNYTLVDKDGNKLISKSGIITQMQLLKLHKEDIVGEKPAEMHRKYGVLITSDDSDWGTR